MFAFQIISQELLRKYLTYAKLNVFPRFQDKDMAKLTKVYADLRKESSVRFLFMYCLSGFESVFALMFQCFIFIAPV